MRKHAGVVLFVLGGWLVSLGCGSSSNNGVVCQQTPFAGAGVSNTTVDQTNNACTMAGGTCGAQNGGATQCPPGTHQEYGASYGSACGTTSYGGPYGGGGNCGAAYEGAGPAAAQIPCCMPSDGGADGASDAPSDSAPLIGSCQGAPCAPGCACGIIPGTSKPYCFCEGADAGADAAMPTCGSIFCFSGCTCTNAAESSCSCN